MLVIGQAMVGSWQRNARNKAANWWRIMVIRVIIAKVIDKAICTQGGHVP
jgi:membrane-anchored glycerophosphoryl diester phosphodiesterase (GDPDase)